MNPPIHTHGPITAPLPLASRRRLLFVAGNREWKRDSHPLRALHSAGGRLGYDAEVVVESDWPVCSERPSAAFVWNGVHGRRERIVQGFREAGVPVFILERGFFDRQRYTQVDPAGFNHTASWAVKLRDPAPREGAQRFRNVWGTDPAPMAARKGHLLILLQSPGDAQLRGCTFQHPGPLVRAVEAAAPPSLKIRVRSHPRFRWHRRRLGRARMLGGTLAEAVTGAAFAVTVNSNAGNEALAWGCPVLSLGPSLYGMAGAACRAGLAGLDHALEAMADGWTPETGTVANYLHWLACRQWSSDELAHGDVLRNLLDAPA